MSVNKLCSARGGVELPALPRCPARGGAIHECIVTGISQAHQAFAPFVPDKAMVPSPFRRRVIQENMTHWQGELLSSFARRQQRGKVLRDDSPLKLGHSSASPVVVVQVGGGGVAHLKVSSAKDIVVPNSYVRTFPDTTQGEAVSCEMIPADFDAAAMLQRDAGIVRLNPVARDLIIERAVAKLLAVKKRDATAVSPNLIADDDVFMGVLDGDSIEKIVFDDVPYDSVLVRIPQPHPVAAVAGDVADEGVPA